MAQGILSKMLDHLSYSSISAYLTCGRHWQYRYVEQAPALTSTNLLLGSAVHGAIESYITAPNVPINAADLMVNLWRESWSKQLTANEGRVDWGTDTPEALANQGLKMLTHPDTLVALDGLTPLGLEWIEKRVELYVPGVPVPVVGYIDIVTEDGVPGDFKTSARSWSDDKATAETQPLFYLAALNQAGYRLNPDWRFRHYVFVKTKEPKVQIIEHGHKPSQLFWLFEMIRSVWQAIDAGVYPLNPTGWKCAPGYCEYWTRCRGRAG